MIVIPFTSTKIKVYKKYNTRIRTFQLPLPDGKRITPPIFAHQVKITTERQENNKGAFFNFVLQPAIENDMKRSLLPNSHALFQAAIECRRIVDSGGARAAHETTTSQGNEETPF